MENSNKEEENIEWTKETGAKFAEELIKGERNRLMYQMKEEARKEVAEELFHKTTELYLEKYHHFTRDYKKIDEFRDDIFRFLSSYKDQPWIEEDGRLSMGTSDQLK